MKMLLTFLFSCFLSSVLFAQISHDLILYSEDGKKFTLTVSGKLINEEFATSVEIKNTFHDFVKANIQFEDTTIAPINTTIYLASPGTGPNTPQSCVYVIKNKKGKHKVRFESRSEKLIQNPDINIIINN